MTDPGKAPAAGLSTAEAARLLKEHGPNALPPPEREAPWRRFLRQFQSPIIYILLFALALDLGIWLVQGGRGIPMESLVIGIILALNAGLGHWQERKAEEALRELGNLTAPQAWVLRDGTMVRRPSRDLVAGDLVRVEAGDRIPADLQVLEGENLLVDESLLTGESLPADRAVDEPLWAGTLLVRGRGFGRVTRTGPASTMGRLASMLTGIREEPTPLERRLKRFGRRVAWLVLAIAVGLVLAGTAVEGMARLPQVFLFAVALAVAAVPEGLPAVLTLTLALGVRRMAKRAAVVRRLAAVEALGSVTVIASDKTGTLTENRIEVRDIDGPDSQEALRAMVLANDGDLRTGAGDPLDLALLEYARAEGEEPSQVRTGFPRQSVRSFDSASKSMRVTVARDGRSVSYLKGAPEVLLEQSTLPPAERKVWHEKVVGYAGEGYRLLAFARGDGEAEHELDWLGLALLWDPPRPEVPDAVRRAREAGIRVIMVTGDHPATALTVAHQVGLPEARVATGTDLERLDRDGVAGLVREVDVFARVSPEHKLRIVEALQAGGEIVAMTGDGVNDAPALKRADVGIAMGRRGSDVSREVADLVLLDDNFATIVGAVEEGRSIYENIQKFIRFLFSTNLSELLVVGIGALAAFLFDIRDSAGALLLPLTASQILWINLVTDGAPALVLGLDRNPGVMQRGPRLPRAPLLDRPSLRFVLYSGTIKAVIAFAILGLLPRLGESLDLTRTVTFVFLAAGQLLFAYPARRSDVAPRPSPALHLVIAASFVLQLGVVLSPLFRSAFDMIELDVIGWVAVSAGVLISWGMAELVSRLVWRNPTTRLIR